MSYNENYRHTTRNEDLESVDPRVERNKYYAGVVAMTALTALSIGIAHEVYQQHQTEETPNQENMVLISVENDDR